MMNCWPSGFQFTVYDKNPKAMKNLVQAGARSGKSAQDVVESSEIVLACLPASPDVEALYLGPGGLVERAQPNTLLIDLSSESLMSCRSHLLRLVGQHHQWRLQSVREVPGLCDCARDAPLALLEQSVQVVDQRLHLRRITTAHA